MDLAKGHSAPPLPTERAEEATERVFVPTGLPDLLRLLDDSGLGKRLTAADQAELIRCTEIRRYHQGARIYADGAPADSMAVVIQGSVEVLKLDADRRVHRLASLVRGEALGEAALATDQRRTADVYALEPTQLLVIKLAEAADRNWVAAVARQMVDALAHRSQRTTERAVSAATKHRQEQTRRSEVARFMTLLIICMCAYTISLGLVSSAVDQPLIISIVTNLCMLTVVGASIRLIWTSAYPPAAFGLAIHPQWRRELIEAILVAVGMCLGATALKWILVTGPFPFAGQSVFSGAFEARAAGLGPTAVVLTAVYVALCPVQELIARGVLQSMALEMFHGQRYDVGLAVILSNAMFAAVHAHVSVWLSLVSFGSGLLWGALYHRQRSLLGVSVCHAIVGVYGLDVLGFWSLGRPI